VSRLRIRASLAALPPLQCQWALLDHGAMTLQGEGPLSEVSRSATHVQLVIPAGEVVFTRVQLPRTSQRHTPAMLAYAVEELTLSDPDSNLVMRLGAHGDEDVLAIVARHGLQRWLDAVRAIGLSRCEVHCESLLLPRAADEWSLAWDGAEGYVRHGELEGAATDRGDSVAPPLSLKLLLEQAQARDELPRALAVYTTAPHAMPDLQAWQSALRVPVRNAGPWNPLLADEAAGVSLMAAGRGWGLSEALLARLKPAAVIAAVALALHLFALAADWTWLASERRTLRNNMDVKFRAAFPEAVAVVDPVLQMRRQLAQVRRATAVPDSGDFLPMLETVGGALRQLPPGSLRTVSFESGRMTLELSAIEQAAAGRVAAALRNAGMSIETAPGPQRGAANVVVMTVRAP
jgi:general secretion pathway protein L